MMSCWSKYKLLVFVCLHQFINLSFTGNDFYCNIKYMPISILQYKLKVNAIADNLRKGDTNAAYIKGHTDCTINDNYDNYKEEGSIAGGNVHRYLDGNMNIMEKYFSKEQGEKMSGTRVVTKTQEDVKLIQSTNSVKKMNAKRSLGKDYDDIQSLIKYINNKYVTRVTPGNQLLDDSTAIVRHRSPFNQSKVITYYGESVNKIDEVVTIKLGSLDSAIKNSPQSDSLTNIKSAKIPSWIIPDLKFTNLTIIGLVDPDYNANLMNGRLGKNENIRAYDALGGGIGKNYFTSDAYPKEPSLPPNYNTNLKYYNFDGSQNTINKTGKGVLIQTNTLEGSIGKDYFTSDAYPSLPRYHDTNPLVPPNLDGRQNTMYNSSMGSNIQTDALAGSLGKGHFPSEVHYGHFIEKGSNEILDVPRPSIDNDINLEESIPTKRTLTTSQPALTTKYFIYKATQYHNLYTIQHVPNIWESDEFFQNINAPHKSSVYKLSRLKRGSVQK